jgi:hypothetical protein
VGLDLLTVDKGCIIQPPHSYELFRWEQLLNHSTPTHCPKVIIKVWSSNVQKWEKGPSGKACRECWRERGYTSRFCHVDATQVGGAIQQIRFLAVWVKDGWASYWNWPEFEKDLFHTCSMSNLLTPPGLVLHHDYAMPPLTEHTPDTHIHPMPNRPQS